MATKPKKYQHVEPQGELDHLVKRAPGVLPKCSTCGKPVKLVDDNEGPERLKAMFRF